MIYSIYSEVNMNEKLQPEQENQIYCIAKQISTEVEGPQKFDLLDNLGQMVSECFASEKVQAIEEALAKAFEQKELDVVNIIMDEAHIEIETAYYETENGQEYESLMLLMPVVMVTKEKNVKIPSIEQCEEVVRRNLLEAGLIKNGQNFRLGTSRMTKDVVNEMGLQEWWEVHRQIIEEDSTNSEIQSLRTKVTPISVESGISLFYLVPVISAQTSEENQEASDVQTLLNSDISEEIWSKIGQELSNEGVSFTVLPPQEIENSIKDAEYILQVSEFDVFFREYAYQDSAEIGYIQVDEDPNSFAVLFFDSEDETLLNYYIFETDGDNKGFVSMLIEKCMDEPQRNLYSFEETITNDLLIEWSETDDIVDISKLLQKSNQIDLRAAYNASMGFNTVFDKPTLH